MYRRNAYLLIAGALVIVGAVIFFSNPNTFRQSASQVRPQVDPTVMNQVLADDLAMTTSLFVSQLTTQLDHWAERDLNQPSEREALEQEIKEHPHFHSFAVLRNNQVTTAIGDFKEEHLNQLQFDDNDHAFSEPFTKDGQQFLLMAKKTIVGEWIVGEIDLSFVKTFVKDMASVSDANGNFFISGGKSEIDVESIAENPDSISSQTVPELDWKIVVQNEEEEKPLNETNYYEGEAVVKFSGDTTAEQWLENYPSINLVKNAGPYSVLRDESRSTQQLLSILSNDEGIAVAEPNYMLTKQANNVRTHTQSSSAPNDEFFNSYQWNLSQINSEQGWDVTTGVEDVTIAILDTGVDPEHEDLKDKIIGGFNAFDGSEDFYDGHGHGTHVAGIATAITNNISGIAGVSWRNPILAVKVLDDNGEGTSFEVARGIQWATDHGAKVINMSLGDYHHSRILRDAILYAHKKDVVLIAASGNDNVEDPMYPAEYKEVLTVAAVDHNQDRAFFSNYGNHIDVSAPGEHIPSTFPGNNYVIMSGTSMAAPHVAGLAGLIRSVKPELSNVEVLDLIRQTSDDLGTTGVDPYYGHGEINISSALDTLATN